MPVVELRTHRVRVPLHTPFSTAVRTVDHVEAVLVEARDEDGRSGWGEATENWRVTGASLAGIEAAVDGPLRAVVLGRDPDATEPLTRDVGRAVQGNQAARSAVDCALHDLAAVRLSVPLARLLGAGTLRVPTDVTLAAGPAERMRTAAEQRRSEGFDVLKIKLGDPGGDDLRRLKEIGAAVGPGVRLRIDANQGWTPKQAVRLIGEFEQTGLDIELVEQPVAAGDFDGMAYVTARTGVPVMADESVWSPADALRLIRTRGADLLNIKLAKCGGLRPARQLMALAEAAGVGVVLGSMMETHVGTAATAALAATARPGGLLPDLDAAWWLSRPPVTGGMVYDGAELCLPDAPGLGITGLAHTA
ncbi:MULTISPECIES: mandelate racemase/muconate lactonizing enzyme family protein [Streptomyces]|uniref:mandelate racemase/muconate lactonizing enzyme family protein n=1 Tax=Streptomyces TaxID=1883 RepID=UPI0004CBFA71|nr:MULTISPECIES: dipeptide epimerase [Streptomyces]